MGYKEENKRAYNTHPEKFDQHFGDFFKENITPFADTFIDKLTGNKILDLGSGPGNHAAYLTKKGLEVTCVDLSEEMVKLCHQKGLTAYIGDIENLDLPDHSFDGVWSSCSLLHIPKNKIKKVLKSIKTILRSGGIVRIAIKDGHGARYELNDKYPNIKRWFVYYSDDEFRKLLEKDFRLLEFSRTSSGRHNYLNYLLSVKK